MTGPSWTQAWLIAGELTMLYRVYKSRADLREHHDRAVADLVIRRSLGRRDADQFSFRSALVAFGIAIPFWPICLISWIWKAYRGKS